MTRTAPAATSISRFTWVGAGVSLLAIVPLSLIGQVGHVASRERAPDRGPFPVLPVALLIVHVYLSQGGWASCQVFCSAYMDADLHLSSSLIGLVTSVGLFVAILAPLLTPRLAVRRGNGWTLLVTTLGRAASLAQLALIPHWAAAGRGRMGVGVLAAIMGVGGGFIMVPVMIYLLRMPMHVVVGTSLFQILFTCINVTILQATFNHTVDFVLALLLLVGSVIGAQVGARVNRYLKADQLKILMSIIVLVVMVNMLVGLLVPLAVFALALWIIDPHLTAAATILIVVFGALSVGRAANGWMSATPFAAARSIATATPPCAPRRRAPRARVHPGDRRHHGAADPRREGIALGD